HARLRPFLTRRSSDLIGQKLGMTQVFDENAQARPVTVIKAGPVRVVQIKTPEKDGYSAVQIAFGEVKPNRVNNPAKGHYAKAGRSEEHTSELQSRENL